MFDDLVEHLYLNRDFYVAALTSNAQNNLREHIFKLVYTAITSKIIKILGTRKMAPADMNLIANYFSNAIVGCITQWAKEGMQTSPDEYSINFYPITEKCLEFIIAKYIEK